MKPMSKAHFAILRQHMVEVIGIQVDLASEELGKAALDERTTFLTKWCRRCSRPPPEVVPDPAEMADRLFAGVDHALPRLKWRD